MDMRAKVQEGGSEKAAQIFSEEISDYKVNIETECRGADCVCVSVSLCV